MPANAFADVIAPRAFAGMARSYRFSVNQTKKRERFAPVRTSMYTAYPAGETAGLTS